MNLKVVRILIEGCSYLRITRGGNYSSRAYIKEYMDIT